MKYYLYYKDDELVGYNITEYTPSPYAIEVSPEEFERVTGIQVIFLEDVRKEKLQKNSQTCQSLIYSGFDSTAKYADGRHYRFNADDQMNMIGNIMQINAGATSVQWQDITQDICENWVAAEFQQLVSNAMAFKANILVRQDEIKIAIKSCTTIEELNAVDMSYII